MDLPVLFRSNANRFFENPAEISAVSVADLIPDLSNINALIQKKFLGFSNPDICQKGCEIFAGFLFKKDTKISR